MNLAQHAVYALSKRIKKFAYRRIPGLAGTFPYFGVKVYFPPDSLIFLRACDEGIYEQSLVRILTGLVRPGTSYFDVGANIGLLSIPILATCPKTVVVSFEPSPITASSLRKTIQESRYSDRWSLVAKACGTEGGTADFCAHVPGLGAYDGFQNTNRVGQAQKIRVPVTTLDEEWKLLGKPVASVFKIDVEGAELQVLQGAKECIEAHRPAIVLEWNSTNLTPHKCSESAIIEFAAQLSYRLFSLPALAPITDSVILGLQMLQTESFLLVPGEFDPTGLAFTLHG